VEFTPTAPTNTAVLWVDTDDPGDAVIPVGGTTGQSLVKLSNSDYDTGWTDTTDVIMTIMQAY
jgi:hypothetical protein